VFFLKKVVSRSLSTTKSSIFFPIFRLTSRSNPLKSRFRTLKTYENTPESQLKTFSGPGSATLEQAQTRSKNLKQAHSRSPELESCSPEGIMRAELNLSSAKLKRAQQVHTCSTELE